MMPGSPGAHPDPRVFIPVTAAGHPAPALRTFPVMSLPSLPEGLTYVLTTRSALVDLTPKLKYPTLVASTPGCAVRPGTTVYILFFWAKPIKTPDAQPARTAQPALMRKIRRNAARHH